MNDNTGSIKPYPTITQSENHKNHFSFISNNKPLNIIHQFSVTLSDWSLESPQLNGDEKLGPLSIILNY
jgi:hypothetical protein